MTPTPELEAFVDAELARLEQRVGYRADASVRAALLEKVQQLTRAALSFAAVDSKAPK